jgi:hypothetical protein
MSRHIGGSILPPSEPRILQPIETPFGTLQVRALPDLDTHALFHKHDRGESLLAMHANGYSCHVLLERMVKGNVEAVRQQAQYILDCGGLARNIDAIVRSMQP